MSDDAMICISMSGNGRHYVWLPGRGVGSLICFSKLLILELQILISHHERKFQFILSLNRGIWNSYHFYSLFWLLKTENGSQVFKAGFMRMTSNSLI